MLYIPSTQKTQQYFSIVQISRLQSKSECVCQVELGEPTTVLGYLSRSNPPHSLDTRLQQHSLRYLCQQRVSISSLSVNQSNLKLTKWWRMTLPILVRPVCV